MVDKLVGDAVHAFFNMPLDVPDHPMKAVACAIAIRGWTELYRLQPIPSALGFGRTRIGIETGDAIVGDIGLRAKLDYTAHGATVTAASRLETANKELGSAICVGPTAASRCAPSLLRPTGLLRLRGFSFDVRTYEPWPDDANAAWRSRYLEAWSLAGSDPARAACVLRGLAGERPNDAVPVILAQRLVEGS
jgi:adenylate cyclase